VILSTCNRTELWISLPEKDQLSFERDTFESGDLAKDTLSPVKMLCEIKGVEPTDYQELFSEREGEEAILHLLEVACGLDSKIFGEDQIISQVREAVQLARDNQCTDVLLEKVFQTAIAAAKKVKSQVVIASADRSTALQVLSLLKEKLGNLDGVSCLMIGNGKMGQLVCNTLLAQGATVKMTLRKAVHGTMPTQSAVPEGCIMVPYEDRIRELRSSKVVISATRSPHYTLKKNEVGAFLNDEPSIWIDLAVPRDIESEIGVLPNIELFDIDHLAGEENQKKNQKARREASKILAFRTRVPEIQDILRLSVEDVSKRLEQTIGSAELSEAKRQQISNEIERAVEKSVGKLLFGLKDTLRYSLWKECLDAVHEAASRDTLKS
jgi:glutamyl-tRNA reductase